MVEGANMHALEITVLDLVVQIRLRKLVLHNFHINQQGSEPAYCFLNSPLIY
ncbi:hypothetical protein LR48_Vigan511s008700 [Vigna angularis]|uniref:Uncharacterized protein n=1 Tax=Phaseolus angularis TaxID=3914 RepID=A0A0L9TDM4_PHAAN|nr:hypothetical protein LR48_Vigan511s008700 [Vigna angularis]